MKPIYCCLWMILLGGIMGANAQRKEYDLRNITQEDGLPSNESYFVYRDSHDFLWFATDNGVVRYNGSRMEHFSLPDNVVFKIREDAKGRIWFFSRTGKLAYFHREKIYPFPYNDSIIKYCRGIHINDATINEQDEVIISSNNFYNYRVSSTGKVTAARFAAWDEVTDIPLNNEYTSLHAWPTRNGRYFIEFTNLRLSMHLPDTVEIKIDYKGQQLSFRFPDLSALVASQFGIQTADDRNFYLFYKNAIVHFSPGGKTTVRRFPTSINSILVLPGNTLWIGTLKKGAELLDSNLTTITPSTIAPGKSVTSIRTDNEGGTWFSTLDKGIFYLKNQKVARYTGDSALMGAIQRLAPGLHDDLLFANQAGIYKLNDGTVNPIILRNIIKLGGLEVDSLGNIISCGSYGLYKCAYGERIPLPGPAYRNAVFLTHPSPLIKYDANYYINCDSYNIVCYSLKNIFSSGCISPSYLNRLYSGGTIYLDQRHKLWLGTMSNLYTLDSMLDSAHLFSRHPAFKNGVTCISQFSNGLMCCGLRFGGLAIFSDTGLISVITEKQGLLSNTVKYILPQGNDCWVVTPYGISVVRFSSFEPLRYHIVNLGKNAGIFNMVISQILPFKNKMLLATTNGMYEIDQYEKLLQQPPGKIPFYIQSVSYYKGDTSQLSSINVPAGNSKLLIRCNALCFNLPEELHYYYRFASSDTSWNIINSPDLLLENMIPGTYELELKAAIPSLNRYSAIQHLTITIEKPWWQATWLKGLAALLLAILLFLVIRYRIDRIARRARATTALTKKMLELEQTALRSQMNPHFIFNCLTSIQQLVVSGNKVEANDYLVKFARLIRKTLDLSNRPYILLDEEINYLREYVVLEQLRMPDTFDFEIETTAGLNTTGTEIPNMMLQPLIENSIRHGIKNLSERKGLIQLFISKSDGRIGCTITDNGTGRMASYSSHNSAFSRHKSLGLETVRKRLEILAGEAYRDDWFVIEDLSDASGAAAGTRVTIYLPCKNTRL